MAAVDTPSISEAVAKARLLVNSNDVERAEVLHELRRSLQLSRTVRGLKLLLAYPSHRALAERALLKMGLAYAG